MLWCVGGRINIFDLIWFDRCQSPVNELVAEEGDEGVEILASAVDVGRVVVGLQRHQQSSHTPSV